MENLTTKNLYVIIDKNFEHPSEAYSQEVYMSQDEALEICDKSNLEYYLSIEGKVENSDESNKSKYSVMDIDSAVKFILEHKNTE
jgi:hypothetical protein